MFVGYTCQRSTTCSSGWSSHSSSAGDQSLRNKITASNTISRFSCGASHHRRLGVDFCCNGRYICIQYEEMGGDEGWNYLIVYAKIIL